MSPKGLCPRAIKINDQDHFGFYGYCRTQRQVKVNDKSQRNHCWRIQALPFGVFLVRLRKMFSDRRRFQGKREWESDGWSLFFTFYFWLLSELNFLSLLVCCVVILFIHTGHEFIFPSLHTSMISPSIPYFSSNHISHVWGFH